MAGVPPVHFLVQKGLGLVLWASVYTTLSWIFAAQVEPVLVWVMGSLRLVLPAASVLIVGAGVWRLVRVRLHGREHAPMHGEAEVEEV